VTGRDYTTRTVDGARAHAAQYATPEPVDPLDGVELPAGEDEQHKEDADDLG
jgi:hypothetical protein